MNSGSLAVVQTVTKINESRAQELKSFRRRECLSQAHAEDAYDSVLEVGCSAVNQLHNAYDVYLRRSQHNPGKRPLSLEEYSKLVVNAMTNSVRSYVERSKQNRAKQ